MKELKKMRAIDANIQAVRQILKENEKENKSVRRKITALWNDRSQDEAVAKLGQRLRTGKQVVKSCQSMIGALKQMHKSINRCYDVRKAREVAYNVLQGVMAS